MNYNLSLLRSLYFAASGKYQKFRVRFDKAIQTGRFHKLSKRKQSSLVSRLKKLYERLKSLQTQLRIAGAGAALSLTLSVSNPVHAQSSLGPFEINDGANPLPPPFNFLSPRPAVVDIDNDGDLDVFVGTLNGEIEFFRNNANVAGPKSVRRFTQVTGSSNPFNGINAGPQATPSFADVDDDGDLDMLLGVNDPNYGYNYSYSRTFFFRNTGSITNPVFTEQTGASNPFNGIYGSKYSPSIPIFVDIDDDGDQDLFVGSSYSYDYYYGSHNAVRYFENNAGVFSSQASSLASELGDLNNVSISFADIDADLDLDAIVGTNSSAIKSFRQDPGLTFTEVFGSENPFNGINFNFPSPAAADLDGDLDLDFLVGTGNIYSFGPHKSNLQYFENTDAAFTLKDRTDLNTSPFGGVDVGLEAAPVFTDLDGDGDLDAVIGAKYAEPDLFVYENENGNFTADPDHPLIAGIDAIPGFIEDVIPVFVDIDNDNDQDAFICLDTRIEFLRKSGSNFILEPTLFPTLNSSNSDQLSLAFVDVDNDGDFDALIGNTSSEYGFVEYFQNQGSSTNPQFVKATAPALFNSLLLPNNANPNLSAVDLDNDGDTDIVMSETYYFQSGYNGDRTRVRFFENKSDGTFEEEANPLIEYGSPALGFTSFGDIDRDGDLDAFMGNGYSTENGKVTYFENINPPPQTNVTVLPLAVVGGQPIQIDPTLTISDPDNDNIAQAYVTIENFVVGEEELSFTPLAGIEGAFDSETGILTFIGKSSIATYQTLLRSVTFNYTGSVPGARKSSAGGVLDLTQSIIFEVRDTDFTLTIVSVVSLNIVPGASAAELDIYNAMSPNTEDDLNPFFKIEHIETVSPENEVIIYNRWGDVVFEVKDYNNNEPAKRFEGVNKNGKDLPTGTYFYKIEITGKTVTGYLSLKR